MQLINNFLKEYKLPPTEPEKIEVLYKQKWEEYLNKVIDNNNYLTIIGGTIKVRRQALNLSQAELGKLIGQGQCIISQIENGKLNITFSLLEKVCRQLGLRISLNYEL